MRLLGNIKDIKSRLNAAPSKDVLQTTRNWFNDRYEWVQVQRNMFILISVVMAVSVTIMAAGVSFIKSSRTIEPFVIEIEPKTGVPTVVIPKTSQALSEDEAVRNFYVWYYVRMREEYYFNSYVTMLRAVRLMSEDDVYYEYWRSASPGNSQSSYTILGQSGVRTAALKSMIFDVKSSVGPDGKQRFLYTAQLRVRLTSKFAGGTNETSVDKFIRMEFEMKNLELNADDRLINPLGFYVSQYQITDDKVL